MRKIILGMMIMLFATFSIYITCLANETEKKEITNDFKLYSRSMEPNGNIIWYGVYLETDDERLELDFKASDYNLPPNLLDFNDDIRLRITYIPVENTVLKCEVINNRTGEIISDISEENINKLFNIEYGKTIVEHGWTEEIKLSDLKENEVYKYTANSTVQFPKITNDIDNCIIYIKENDDESYEKEISMYKSVSSSSFSVSFNEFEAGESFFIVYRKATNEDLFRLIEKDDIIYLNNYKDGDKLEYRFEEYIYNNTDKDITIHIKDAAFGVETSDSVTIESEKIYGFDWMIDSATITYDSLKNNTQEQEIQKDETITNQPQTPTMQENESSSTSNINNSCKKVDAVYYDKNGNITTKEQHEKECLENPDTGNIAPFILGFIIVGLIILIRKKTLQKI